MAKRDDVSVSLMRREKDLIREKLINSLVIYAEGKKKQEHVRYLARWTSNLKKEHVHV